MKRFIKDHLIPHTGNGYRPHLLQRTAMTAMLGLVLVSFAMANLQAVLWLNVDWLVSAVLPAVVIGETNDERNDEALAPLTRNAALDKAAQLKAEHMANTGYFAHYAPDGTSPWHWFRVANYPFVYAGENLAVHFNDSREVVRAWMDSPTHRANIMNENFTEIGIGVAEGAFEGYNTVFVVQMFGAPAQVAAAPTPETITVVTEQVTEPVPSDAPFVASAKETIVEAPVSEPAVEATPEPAPVPETYTLPNTNNPEQYAVANTEVPLPASTTELVIATESATTSPVPEAEQFITTSTNAIPASIAPDTPTDSGRSTLWGQFATSPQLVLQSLYTVLGVFVVLILLLSLAVEFRRHNSLQMAYSLSLLLVMGGLYYLQTLVTTGATIL